MPLLFGSLEGYHGSMNIILESIETYILVNLVAALAHCYFL